MYFFAVVIVNLFLSLSFIFPLLFHNVWIAILIDLRLALPLFHSYYCQCIFFLLWHFFFSFLGSGESNLVFHSGCLPLL